MLKITKILTGRNVSVFLNNGERLLLTYETYSSLMLKSDMELESEVYLRLSDESSFLNCISRALSSLARGGRSVYEMRQYLKKKGFDEEIIERALIYLNEKNYLNDYDFAINYITRKMCSGKRGRGFIIRELLKKGIDRKSIDMAIKESGLCNVDMDLLYEMALKKYKSLKDKKNVYAKISSFLSYRGFDYDSIASVLRKLQEENKEDSDFYL
jgi:regulatory protein